MTDDDHPLGDFEKLKARKSITVYATHLFPYARLDGPCINISRDSKENQKIERRRKKKKENSHDFQGNWGAEFEGQDDFYSLQKTDP